MTLSGALQPGVVNVTNSAGNYVMSGSGTIGNFGVTPTTLTKLGSSNLTLEMSAASTYTGATTVGEGMLSINFSALASHSNLISASSALVLSGGTLNVTGAGDGDFDAELCEYDGEQRVVGGGGEQRGRDGRRRRGWGRLRPENIGGTVDFHHSDGERDDGFRPIRTGFWAGMRPWREAAGRR